MTRSFWVLVHRYVGLVMAGFLIVAGLTGSLLAWYHELDEWLNPHLHRVAPPAPDARPLDPFALRERAERLAGGPDRAWVHYVPLKQESGKAITLYAEGPTDPLTRQHADLGFNQMFLDPYTGEEILRRTWGAITEGWHNLMPFIYRLHYQLALGTIGTWTFGIIALLWTLDCFVGFYLTLPARAGRSGWRRWAPAWKVRWSGGAYKLNFDLHRAGGLWVWAMLFVFAWSSVGLNLPVAYKPVMSALFDYERPYDRFQQTRKLAVDQAQPGIPWREAREIGRRLMEEQARVHGFKMVEESRMSYDPHHALYRYVVRSDRDITDEGASTALWFDANDGRFVDLALPSGQRSGNTVTSWLYALHFGQVFGLPFRVFVCVMGLIVAMLSVTGVYLWLKKRQARGAVNRRSALARDRGTLPQSQ